MSTQAVPYNDFSAGRATAVDPTKDYRHWVFLGVDHSAGKLKAGAIPRIEQRSGIEVRGGLDLGDESRLYGIRYIHRGWPTEILTHDVFNPRGVISRDDAQDAQDDDDAKAGVKFSVGRTAERGWANDLAWSLQSNDRLGLGITVLQSSLDVPRAVMYWVASGLLGPVRDLSVLKKQDWLRNFDPERHLLPVPQDRAWQGWLLLNADGVHPFDYLYRLALKIRDECLESCIKGEAYAQGYYDSYVAEMREALIPGHGGLRKVSDALRICCAELELPTPEDLARQVAVAQAQQAANQLVGSPQSSQPAELIEILRILVANQAASSGVAAPMPNFGEDFPDYQTWLADKKKDAAKDVQPATGSAGPSFEDFSTQAAGEIPDPITAIKSEEPETLTQEAGSKSRTLEEKAKEEEPFTKPKKRNGQ